MKVFLVLSTLFAATLAEAPLDHMHPPSAHAPSSNYGAPSRGLTDAHFSEFGARTSSYNRNHQSSHHQQGYSSHTPSSEYGAPRQDSYNTPSTSYGAPSSEYGAPSAKYGPPSTEYGAPSSSYDPPSTEYGAPKYDAPSSQYGAPKQSSQYGAPNPTKQYLPPSQKSNTPSQKYGAPRTQYGAPKSSYQSRTTPAPRYRATTPAPRYRATTPAPYSDSYSRAEDVQGGPYPGARNEDDMSEPASYEFKYEVNDAASGQEFGHMESREGDVVTGEYRVLLPDGRTQVVKYIADKNGYRPTIEYLEPNQGGPY